MTIDPMTFERTADGAAPSTALDVSELTVAGGEDSHFPTDGTIQPHSELRHRLQSTLGIVPRHQHADIEAWLVSVEEYADRVAHPSIAQEWEELCPGAANRLLTMAENQEAHRIWWERGVLTHSAALQYAGVACAFVACLSLIAGAVYCSAIGQPWVGAACLATSAVGMVQAFLNLRAQENGNRPEPGKTTPPRSKPPASRTSRQFRQRPGRAS